MAGGAHPAAGHFAHAPHADQRQPLDRPAFMLAACSGNTKYAELVKRVKVASGTAANFRDSE